MPPAAGELHVWLGRRETVTDSDHFLRGVLSRYAGASAAQLGFTRGPHGKPALVFPRLGLDFNLSHSGDWLAMAISDGAAVGVDLQYCEAGRDVLRLARRFFSPAELADLQGRGVAECSDRFYDYWTLKEARIKAAGGAIGRDLHRSRFALRDHGPACDNAAVGSIIALGPDSAAGAWYGLFRPLDDYRLALCCHAPREFAAGLSAFELLPGGVAIEYPLQPRALSGLPCSTPGATCE